MRTTITQHIVALALTAVILLLICWMFGEPKDTASASIFLRVVVGLAGLVILHPVCRTLYRLGYLPQEDKNYDDRF